ncbi:MAG: hypothetical protein QME41_01715 [Actinomycetota bacterium]|nr:hypothetical protein [Actinomycetota bacterium]
MTGNKVVNDTINAIVAGSGLLGLSDATVEQRSRKAVCRTGQEGIT